ncbi:hypothetical protein B7P43_G05962 [Cryptotermes secundus]|uniref:Uncharacterized protein n=1 Tax=Cryptotermes secundus TaxID=105785 RepID=A0A2J7PZS1_9NEOP|nr:hypothetical protein B7P43_G05962 [Cryptotermes secundus]
MYVAFHFDSFEKRRASQGDPDTQHTTTAQSTRLFSTTGTRRLVPSYGEMGLEALFALISVLLCLQEAIPQNLENSGDPVIAEARKCRHQHGLTDEEFEEIMRQASLPKEEPIDSRRDEMQEIVDAQTKCQKEHGITDETFIEIRNREMILEDESDESMKLKDGQLDVNAVMNIAKPLLDNIEQQGREVDEESLRSDIANCTDTSKWCADQLKRRDWINGAASDSLVVSDETDYFRIRLLPL